MEAFAMIVVVIDRTKVSWTYRKHMELFRAFMVLFTGQSILSGEMGKLRLTENSFTKPRYSVLSSLISVLLFNKDNYSKICFVALVLES
jgi:two-component SAPR family response regulator